jgi:hypothetical protein
VIVFWLWNLCCAISFGWSNDKHFADLLRTNAAKEVNQDAHGLRIGTEGGVQLEGNGAYPSSGKCKDREPSRGLEDFKASWQCRRTALVGRRWQWKAFPHGRDWLRRFNRRTLHDCIEGEDLPEVILLRTVFHFAKEIIHSIRVCRRAVSSADLKVL